MVAKYVWLWEEKLERDIFQQVGLVPWHGLFAYHRPVSEALRGQLENLSRAVSDAASTAYTAMLCISKDLSAQI
jgi:hypothetical protein